MSIGDRLRTLRARKGVSQQDVADAIEVRVMSISRYERGEMNPSAAMATKLAKYFGSSVEWIMTGEEPAAREEPHVEAADDQVRTALQELLADWPPEYVPPTEEEITWLNEGIHFRLDPRAGFEMTPRLLLQVLIERRRQQAGKDLKRPALEPPPRRPGRRSLGAADAERKAKKRGR